MSYQRFWRERENERKRAFKMRYCKRDNPPFPRKKQKIKNQNLIKSSDNDDYDDDDKKQQE